MFEDFSRSEEARAEKIKGEKINEKHFIQV